MNNQKFGRYLIYRNRAFNFFAIIFFLGIFLLSFLNGFIWMQRLGFIFIIAACFMVSAIYLSTFYLRFRYSERFKNESGIYYDSLIAISSKGLSIAGSKKIFILLSLDTLFLGLILFFGGIVGLVLFFKFSI